MHSRRSRPGSQGLTDMADSGARQEAVRRALIARHSLLGTLDPHSQDILARSSRIMSLRAGDHVFRQGDPGNSFFILCRGSIRVHRQGADGREAVIKILQDDEIFGEVVFSGVSEYPAHATCLEECTVLSLEKAVLESLLEEPGFRNDFISVLMKKMAYLAGRLHTLSVLDVEDRFFRFLLDTWGVRDSYHITMSRKEMALAIGTVPETFSRLLQKLKARGFVSWEGSDLVVNPAVLQEYVEGGRG